MLLFENHIHVERKKMDKPVVVTLGLAAVFYAAILVPFKMDYKKGEDFYQKAKKEFNRYGLNIVTMIDSPTATLFANERATFVVRAEGNSQAEPMKATFFNTPLRKSYFTLEQY